MKTQFSCKLFVLLISFSVCPFGMCVASPVAFGLQLCLIIPICSCELVVIALFHQYYKQLNCMHCTKIGTGYCLLTYTDENATDFSLRCFKRNDDFKFQYMPWKCAIFNSNIVSPSVCAHGFSIISHLAAEISVEFVADSYVDQYFKGFINQK